MIAFGCAITAPPSYEQYAEPGIRRVVEPDSEVLAYGSPGSLFHAYNTIIDKATQLDQLEALVLLHQDAEIISPDFCSKVREALTDPDVALVGCGGAVGVNNIDWWSGSVTWASFTTAYNELGGGEVPGMSWLPEQTPAQAHLGEVETIDGFVMVLSPWAVQELRFDESLGLLHGYDLDFCLQVREAGKKVITKDFRVIHHHSVNLISDREGWINAHMKIADKWEGVLNDRKGTDWKARARRAEAEAAISTLHLQLAELLITQVQFERKRVEDSFSWTVTAPLRAVKNVLRRVRDRYRGWRANRPAIPPKRALTQRAPES